MKLWLPELKQRLRELLAQGQALAALSVLREQRRGRGSASLGFLLHSENSLTKLKATKLALDAPKPSKAIEGSDCESTPACLTFGAAGA